MKLMKFFTIAVSCALVAGVLVGCGDSSTSTENNTNDSSTSTQTVDVQGAAESLLAVNPISNQLKLDENTINLDIALSEDSYTAYAGALSNDQDDAGHVIIIQYADGQEKAVVDALETYRQGRVAFFGNYPDFADAQFNLDNNYALVSGNGMAILAVASNECTDPAAMISAAEGLVK